MARRSRTTLDSLFECEDIFVTVMKQLNIKDVKSWMDSCRRTRHSSCNQRFLFGHFRHTESITLRNFYLNIDLSYQPGFADAPVIFLKLAVEQTEISPDANRDDLIYRRPELF
jgi:hypothetical protein